MVIASIDKRRTQERQTGKEKKRKKTCKIWRKRM